jgi:hypothetical protein
VKSPLYAPISFLSLFSFPLHHQVPLPFFFIRTAFLTSHRKTAAYHAQADGAAERMNQTLEIALRAYLNQRQNNWHRHVGLIELAYNSARHPGTGFSPLQLLYANPEEPVRRLLSRELPNSEDDNIDATNFLDGVQSRLRDAQEAVIKGLAYQREYYNRSIVATSSLRLAIR